jgi:hypothetical protein
LGVAAASLVVFSAAMFGLGALMFTGVGALLFGAGLVAFVALGGALALFGLGLKQVVEPIQGFTDSMSVMSNLDFSSIVNGITQVGEAMSEIESDGLKELKETALWLSMATMKPVRVEFGDLSVNGNIDIEGEGGGKSSTDWVEDPIFVRKLKGIVMEALQADKKGY